MPRDRASYVRLFAVLTLALVGWPVVALAAAEARQPPESAWTILGAMPAGRDAQRAYIRPAKFVAIELRREAAAALLAGAPMEFTAAAHERPLIVALPTPDGDFQRFRVVESPIMEEPLSARFPEIKTYAGQGIDDPNASIRFDLTPAGFHAQVLTPRGAWYIDPYSFDDDATHTAYYRREYVVGGLDNEWQCFGPEVDARTPQATEMDGSIRVGETLRTYRLANAATGEYTAFFGGTVAQGQAAIVTAVNRVSGVYEVDLSVRLVLVANNSSIVYTNAGSDPFSNGNGSAMLSQNQTTCDSVIGSANYDIGHVFSTGGGGIAGLRVVCVNGNKARGVTGLGAPVGDPFYIDYVAHEMGHQFGGNHSFNGTASSCGGNRNAATAVEPGSGSTIMSYAGICGPDDLQPNSDPYFSWVNYDEMIAFTTTGSGNACPAQTPTGNNAPVVSAPAARTIPIQTPFQLTATGSDPNGDPITYCWEQRNVGAAQSATGGAFPDNGSSPFLRSFNPSTSPTRTFPRLTNVLNGGFIFGEAWPNTNRTLTFRVTARDNRAGGGGSAGANVSITTTLSAGPFRVTAPTGAGVSWQSGQRTVTWNVANTASAPVSAASVDILLSTDGGMTFPTVLAAGAPNNGSAVVTIPGVSTTTARVKVQASDNYFFHVSSHNFTIVGCVGDANGDGVINFGDLNIVIGQFGQVGAGLAGDVNGDGQVNFADLNLVISNFGIVC